MNKYYIVIMAGGKGERFWPMSRSSYPKHLIPIVGTDPMLLQTINTALNIVPKENIYLITGESQLSNIKLICQSKLLHENIIVEPFGKDTAAVVGIATLILKRKNPNAIFAVLPSDHVLGDKILFQKTIETSFELLNNNNNSLITIGVNPKFPAIEYGYIKKKSLKFIKNGLKIYHACKFKEKPNLKCAKNYLKSGQYFWNSGIFIWGVKSIENEFRTYAYNLWNNIIKLNDYLDKKYSLNESIKYIYKTIDKISIDYAIMEKSKNVLVIEGIFNWDDVGSWTALDRHIPKDKNQNILKGNIVIDKSEKNIIINDNNNNKMLITAIGVKNLIIVYSKNAILVCNKNNAQDIKNILKNITHDLK